MIQNGTIVSTILMGELDGRTRPEVLCGIHVVQVNLGLAAPILGGTGSANTL